MLAGGLAGTGAPAPVGRSGQAGRVPKILHHTYKTKNPADWPLKSYASAALHPTAAAARPCVPVGLTATLGGGRWVDSSQSCVESNPDWEYLFWEDDANRGLFVKHLPEYLDLYDRIKTPVLPQPHPALPSPPTNR